MKKEEMLKFIDDAIKEQAPYFAVLVDLGLPEPEQIINPLANLEEKKKYYIKSYTPQMIFQIKFLTFPPFAGFCLFLALLSYYITIS